MAYSPYDWNQTIQQKSEYTLNSTRGPTMSSSSSAIATVVQMMESLPEGAQVQVSDHLREYIADLFDEIRWDSAFANSQPQLVAAARHAREEIAAGLAEPMDEHRL